MNMQMIPAAMVTYGNCGGCWNHNSATWSKMTSDRGYLMDILRAFIWGDLSSDVCVM